MQRAPDMTLMVVSRSFPPKVSGTPILLANLLSSYTGEVAAIDGHDPYSAYDPQFRPPCPTHHVGLTRVLGRAYERLRRRKPEAALRLVEPAIRRRLRRHSASVVLGVYPREDYFVAAFLAAGRLGLPFYAHMHDLWVENT